jgi:hypothetical protein
VKMKNLAAAAALAVSSLSAVAGGPLGELGTAFVGGNVAGIPWTDGYSFSIASLGDLWGQTVVTSGIGAYSVTLYDSTFALIGSDSSPGTFSFTGLAAGDYFLTYAGVGAGSYGGTLEVTPVPEPETYALMLAGLGMIGFMAARRSRG